MALTAPPLNPAMPEPKTVRPPTTGERPHWLKLIGGGIVGGASNDDPSAIGTYAAAGAQFGLATLWTALFSLPLISVAVFLSAKIGMVSGMGLAGVLKRHYAPALRAVIIGLLLVANTVNAGADTGAIAAAINLIVPGVSVAALIVPLAIVLIVFQIWLPYKLIIRVFQGLALVLFAYIVAALLAKPDLGVVLVNTLVPRFSNDPAFALTLVAILGTRLSPYLFFWQANQEVEEEISRGRRALWQRHGATREELGNASQSVNIGMFFSNLIMYFIILTVASTLFTAGARDIHSATEAAEALRPLAGDAARLLFAVGLIASGLVAVPVLAGGCAYAVAESFGWPCGLNQKPAQAKRFYLVIALVTGIGACINFIPGLNLFDALVWAAAINGLLAPVLLLLLLHIANNRQVMGIRINRPLTNLLGGVTTLILLAAAGVFLWQMLV